MDEPALREGLPLKTERWQPYLAWAVEAFRLSTAVAQNHTQIVTHLCYSDFADILEVMVLSGNVQPVMPFSPAFIATCPSSFPQFACKWATIVQLAGCTQQLPDSIHLRGISQQNGKLFLNGTPDLFVSARGHYQC